MRFALVVFCVLGVLVALPGCKSNGDAEPDLSPITIPDEYEEQLRELVLSSVERERRNQGEGSARLLQAKPYFYKEYWLLPEGEPVYSADFTDKESVSTPRTAEVELEKTRFSTRVHRDKGEARSDDNFLRSTGIEQSSYELRHGQWHRIGSLFLAQDLDEFRDGEWVQVEERREILSIEEDTPTGFWQRLMFWRD